MLTSHLLRRSVASAPICHENRQMKLSELTNPSHRGAYKKGKQARIDGLPRVTPYTGRYASKYALERAWLAGYDSTTGAVAAP